MASTGHEQKMANLTRQMRHNQTDLQSFLSDLDSWEKDIKTKEEKLMNENDKEEAKSSLPPVRNTIHKKKLKKKKKEKQTDPDKQKKKISGFDFNAWDKFDVDKACEEVDKEENKTSSSEYETDEEWELERKKHLAALQKDKGNKYFKNEDYDAAVEAYTRGMEFDGTNAVLPANRAMALLKQQKFAAAELDCTLSISLDPLYIKAYLRRATARVNLSKHKGAIEDFNRVLDLEPTNKMASNELERLQKELDRDKQASVSSTLIDGEKGIVKPIYKSPEDRSKVPLRVIPIEEIGIETTKRNQNPLTDQSDTTKRIAEKEAKNFEKLISSSSNATMTTDKSENASSQSRHQDKSHDFNERLSDINEIGSKANAINKTPSSSDWQKKAVKIEEIQSEVSEEVKVNGIGVEEVKPLTKKPDTSSSTKQPPIIKESADIPAVPQSSFQFQTDFKAIKTKSEVFFKYFTAIDPSQYPVLFGQCLDAEILNSIIKTLLQQGQGRSKTNIYEVLLGLTNVKRFSMTAMFLSRKEKQDAKELMDRISLANQCSQQELAALRKKYDL